MSAFRRLPRDEIELAMSYLDEVGLLHLACQWAGTLSSGQAQRVAVGPCAGAASRCPACGRAGCQPGSRSR
ncbi:MAG: hypothetical protein CBARDMAM_7283 [uncultured Caballeronia sp.]|nr:MAG: hypothetical protein CBARDMAM_7283 [uncultured Caballeronia sp.]